MTNTDTPPKVNLRNTVRVAAVHMPDVYFFALTLTEVEQRELAQAAAQAWLAAPVAPKLTQAQRDMTKREREHAAEVDAWTRPLVAVAS